MGHTCRSFVFFDDSDFPESVAKVLTDQAGVGISGIVIASYLWCDKDFASGLRNFEIKIVIFVQNKILVKKTDRFSRGFFKSTERYSVAVSFIVFNMLFAAAESKGRIIGCGYGALHRRLSFYDRWAAHIVGIGF